MTDRGSTASRMPHLIIIAVIIFWQLWVSLFDIGPSKDTSRARRVFSKILCPSSASLGSMSA
jgi:hypothetical protein